MIGSIQAILQALLVLLVFSRICVSFGVGKPQCPRILNGQKFNRLPTTAVSLLNAGSCTPSDKPCFSFRSKRASLGLQNSLASSTSVQQPADIFAKLVSKGFEYIPMTETQSGVPFSAHPPSKDRITIYSVRSNSSDSIEAWVLPTDVMGSWLHNEETKQQDSLFQQVLIRRMDNYSLLLENKTIDDLLIGDVPIWIGLPGIGKTVGSTVVLVKALESIKNHHINSTVDGFDVVYYRVGDRLYKFDWDAGDGDSAGTLRGEELKDEKKAQVLKYLQARRKNTSRKDTLIVELKEKEMDPEQRGFYTGSSRMAIEQTFKALGKSGAMFYVMQPPSHEQLRLMYSAVHHFCDKLPEHIDSYSKFEALEERFGPVPRVLFARGAGIVSGYDGLRQAALREPFTDIGEHSISNVGSHLKYFLAPFVRDTNVIATSGVPPNYVFKFLSEECKLLLGQRVQLPRHLAFLVELGQATELLEALVKYGGVMKQKQSWTSSVPQGCRLEKWDWYRDPGKEVLTEGHRMNSSQIPVYPLCEREVHCSGDKLSIPVWELKPRTLYTGFTETFPVVEWLFVDHEKKRVYGHQATVSKFSQHGFKTSTVDKLLKRLSFHDERANGYKLVMIGVNDVSLANPNGMIFEDDKEKKESLAYFQNPEYTGPWQNAQKIETYIVRIRGFEKLDEVQLAPGESEVTIAQKSESDRKRREIAKNLKFSTIVEHRQKDKSYEFRVESKNGESSWISLTAARKINRSGEYVAMFKDKDKALYDRWYPTPNP